MIEVLRIIDIIVNVEVSFVVLDILVFDVGWF